MAAKKKTPKKTGKPLWADEAPGFKAHTSPEIIAAFEGAFGPPEDELRSVTNLALLLSALNTINELFRRARAVPSDEPNPRADVASDYYLRLAMHLTLHLDDLVQQPRHVLRELAQATPFWPSLWCPNIKKVAPFHEKLTALGVGKNHQINFGPSAKWRPDGTARAWAFRITLLVWTIRTKVKAHLAAYPIGQVQMPPEMKVALDLPPLTKRTAKEWMEKAGWPLVLDATGGEPEKDPDLSKLGSYRGTEPSRIRDAIKKSLLQALVSLAGD